LAETIGMEISNISERHACWKAIAEARVSTDGWQTALECSKELQTDEARLFYLKGWVWIVHISETDDSCIRQSLPMLAGDHAAIGTLLQKYALRLAALGNPSPELTDRLNRTLNIRWLLDLVARFPKHEAVLRLSANLEEWLQAVDDVDDREQIMLWARQVAKGKMTEDQFQANIRGIM
jgi:hypothetical protein